MNFSDVSLSRIRRDLEHHVGHLSPDAPVVEIELNGLADDGDARRLEVPLEKLLVLFAAVLDDKNPLHRGIVRVGAARG